jgi:hypothetical protein
MKLKPRLNNLWVKLKTPQTSFIDLSFYYIFPLPSMHTFLPVPVPTTVFHGLRSCGIVRNRKSTREIKKFQNMVEFNLVKK